MMDIMDAAKYLIYLSYAESKHSLTPLKLQKLLYLAQGWSYVWDNCSLFPDEFEAWQYGPVNIDIYEHFKKYGRAEIPQVEGDMLNSFGKECKATLKAIWEGYGSYSAFELVELTHSQDPWKYAFSLNVSISNDDIKHYFQTKF